MGRYDDPATGMMGRLLAYDVESWLKTETQASVVPVLTLPACGHPAMLLPGRYLCDACDALDPAELPEDVRRRLA